MEESRLQKGEERSREKEREMPEFSQAGKHQTDRHRRIRKVRHAKGKRV